MLKNAVVLFPYLAFKHLRFQDWTYLVSCFPGGKTKKWKEPSGRPRSKRLPLPAPQGLPETISKGEGDETGASAGQLRAGLESLFVYGAGVFSFFCPCLFPIVFPFFILFLLLFYVFYAESCWALVFPFFFVLFRASSLVVLWMEEICKYQQPMVSSDAFQVARTDLVHRSDKSRLAFRPEVSGFAVEDERFLAEENLTTRGVHVERIWPRRVCSELSMGAFHAHS